MPVPFVSLALLASMRLLREPSNSMPLELRATSFCLMRPLWALYRSMPLEAAWMALPTIWLPFDSRTSMPSPSSVLPSTRLSGDGRCTSVGSCTTGGSDGTTAMIWSG